MENNDYEELREILLGVLKVVNELTVKVAQLEENMKKIGFYEIKSSDEIIKGLNKKIVNKVQSKEGEEIQRWIKK
jgi:endonuclease III-like uncharacterized protein